MDRVLSNTLNFLDAVLVTECDHLRVINKVTYKSVNGGMLRGHEGEGRG